MAQVPIDMTQVPIDMTQVLIDMTYVPIDMTYLQYMTNMIFYTWVYANLSQVSKTFIVVYLMGAVITAKVRIKRPVI